MTPRRWRQIEEVFDRAVDLAAEERRRFLDAACAADDELRVEVEQLLASTSGASDSIQETIARGAALLRDAVIATSIGTLLGPYRLQAVIGEGGMGTVYLATRDDAEYRREVAIKILHPGAKVSVLAARLRDERQLLASLDHPGIVRLLDGGTTGDGLPYLVMEYVDGVPLTTYACELPVRQRLELVIQVAVALQYAHQQLVVHRDIKPSNILVDARGVPKLLDFGIAKLLDHGASREAKTATGMALFTVEYASPEQIRGEAVSVATDVYSLGAVLYQVLTASPPQRRGATLVETLANVCDRDPPLPSTLVAGGIRRQIAGDLDNIVLKALQKSPAHRYSSIAALVDDLRRFLDGRPVAAREATLTYRARKFARRHAGKLALAMFVAGSLSAATVISIKQARRADRQAARAERDNRRLLRARGIAELAAGHAARALPFFAEVLRDGDDTPTLRFLLAEALRPFDRRIAEIPTPSGAQGIAWAPDGKRFAITSIGGVVELAKASGEGVMRIPAGVDRLIEPIFAPDGSAVASFTYGHLFVWDAATGELRWTVDLDPGGPTAAFTSDGRMIVAVSSEGWGYMFDAHDGTRRATVRFDGTKGQGVAFAVSPDDRHVAIGTASGALYVWNVQTGVLQRLGEHTGGVRALRFGPDGSRLYSGGADHAVRIWEVATGEVIRMLTGHTAAIETIQLDQTGARVITAGKDNTAILWNAETGALLATIGGVPQGGIVSARISPDGSHILTIGHDGTFRVWDDRGDAEMVLEGAPGLGEGSHSDGGTAIDARFSPDGTKLLTASSRQVGVYHVERAPLVADRTFDGNGYAVAWSPDDKRLAVVGNHIACVRDAATLGLESTMEQGGQRWWDVAWSPDGTRLAIAGDDGAALIRDLAGARVTKLAGHAGTVNSIAWSRDGARIVTAADDQTARIWDAATSAQLATLSHPGHVMAAAWAPDGTLIATTCTDRHLRVWSVATAALVTTIDTANMQLLGVAFSPDGRSLVATGHDGQVNVFDVATGRRTLSLEGHNDAVPTASWSPDGALLATAGYDGAVRIWDAATGEQLAARPASSLMGAVWSHDGSRIAAVSDRGELRVWDASGNTEPAHAVLKRIADRVPYRLIGTQLVRN